MNCKNCNLSLSNQDSFCPNCGGKIIHNRLTFKNLLQHFSETFLNYDNKFIKTIVKLVQKPEDVINGYIAGVRKKYINPISFFAISLTISGFAIFIIKKYYNSLLDFSNLYENEAQQKMMQNVMEGSFEYSSLIYSALIPFLAIISLIVFYNKKYNLTEHIVIYLYSMSLFSIVSAILGQIILLINPQFYINFSVIIYILIFIYHCYMLKRLFSLSNSQILIKTIIFLVLFFVLYVAISILIVIVLAAIGVINFQDFAPK